MGEVLEEVERLQESWVVVVLQEVERPHGQWVVAREEDPCHGETFEFRPACSRLGLERRHMEQMRRRGRGLWRPA